MALESLAPLAAIGIDHQRRFSGINRLYGKAHAARIFAAHLVVVGLGGVGSWSAEALARSGVKRMTLVDMDHIAESNINRQIHALDATLGAAKIQAMRERIRLINPECEVHLIDDWVTPANWSSLQEQISAFAPIDGLIDACDQVSAKTGLAAWALAQKKSTRFITVGAAGGKRLAHLNQISDLARVTHDPLLAKMRYQLRRHHAAERENTIGIACVHSVEPVAAAADSKENGGAPETQGANNLNCHGFGSSVAVTASFGLCAASWMMNRL